MKKFNLSKLREYDCEPNEYSFLKKEPNNNLILLTLAGSHAYGTNVQDSDIDIRGISTNQRSSILTMNDFEVYHSSVNDTEIYSLEKFIKMATKCSPNILELLGLEKEKYIFLNEAGELLIDNKEIFLSQLCIKTFEGYAQQQLKKIDKMIKSETEISKINKNIMHLIRIKTMLSEILENEDINTYRRDKEFLLRIRNGAFLTDRKINNEFLYCVDKLDKRIEYAKKNTTLKMSPDIKKIREIHEFINLKIIITKENFVYE